MYMLSNQQQKKERMNVTFFLLVMQKMFVHLRE